MVDIFVALDGAPDLLFGNYAVFVLPTGLSLDLPVGLTVSIAMKSRASDLSSPHHVPFSRDRPWSLHHRLCGGLCKRPRDCRVELSLGSRLMKARGQPRWAVALVESGNSPEVGGRGVPRRLTSESIIRLLYVGVNGNSKQILVILWLQYTSVTNVN